MVILSVLETINILYLFKIIDYITNYNSNEVEARFSRFIDFSQRLGLSPEKYIGITFLTLICFKVFFQVYLSFHQTKLATAIVNRLGKDVQNTFLNNSFFKISQIESSNLIKILTIDLNNVQTLIIIPFLGLISELFIVTGLIVLLLIIEPLLTFTFLFLLLIFYFVLFNRIKNKIFSIGQMNQKDNNRLISLIQEIFEGIRDIIILNKISMYSQKAKKAIDTLYDGVRTNLFLSTLPRSVLDFFFFASFALLLLFKLDLNQPNAFIFTIVIFAATAIRILPGLSKLSNSITQMNFGSASLNSVITFSGNDNERANSSVEIDYFKTLESNIYLKDFSFRYSQSELNVFENQNFTVKSNSINLLYGESGSGKSTLTHIILGLYPISKGQFLYGTNPVKFHSRNWLDIIGFLPQKVFIANNTLLFNITLTDDFDKIDHKQLEQAIINSGIKKLISSKAQDGLDFVCGENGSKLSGGEIQRIGIARLLYFNRKVLVFDEPTSALDYETGNYIRKTLKRLSRSHTVLIISHDKSMSDIADYTSHIQNGQIFGEGFKY